MKACRGLFLTGAALLLSGISANEARAEGIINGSFETGDLTGWMSNDSSFTSAELSVVKLMEPGAFFPTDGDYLGYLLSGIGEGEPTLLSQTFEAASISILDFNIFFDSGDGVFNDYGFARLLDGAGGLVAELFYRDSDSVGGVGSTNWEHVTYAFTAAGTYTLQFGVANVGDNDSFFSSAVGVDAVSLFVPEPSTFVLSSLVGLAWLGGRIAVRRRPKSSR